jgi:Zn-dependent peptidase ImmA (M78 family)
MSVITTPSQLSLAAIRQYAERVGRTHEIYDADGYADIDGLVDKLGGTVVVQDSGESMHVAGKSNFVIFLPSFTSTRRDKFTKAHELGHYFLHYRHAGITGQAAFRRGGRNLAETQANVFAASLLMPETEFRAAVRRHNGDYWKVAAQFDVSPAAAEVRSQVLGLA